MQESFAGPFRWQSGPTSTWESVHSSHTHSHCNSHHQSHSSSLHPSTSSSLLEAEKYQLMDRAVQPTARHGKNGLGPLIRLDLERFSHIAVDVVATKIHSSVHVLYVASARDGLIRKYSVLPRTQEACLVEIIDPFKSSSQLADRQIKTMQYLRQQVCHITLVLIVSRLFLSFLFLCLSLSLCEMRYSPVSHRRTSFVSSLSPFCNTGIVCLSRVPKRCRTRCT